MESARARRPATAGDEARWFLSKAVAADDLLTQTADFDCPRPKWLKSLRRAGLATDEVGQRISAAWVNPASAPTGIVESGVKYLKGNFLALREFRHLADLNEQASAWVRQVAGQRVHGTTRQAPLALFAMERPLMQALPPQAPDPGTWHRVTLHPDCHVKFDYRLYSAPFALVGKVLWLRATDGAVALFDDFRHVATHCKALKLGERMTVRDHLPPDAQRFFAHDRQWLASQARLVGAACEQLVERLLADKILERLRAAQGVIGLGKTYGHPRLEAACARALAHDSPFYRARCLRCVAKT